MFGSWERGNSIVSPRLFALLTVKSAATPFEPVKIGSCSLRSWRRSTRAYVRLRAQCDAGVNLFQVAPSGTSSTVEGALRIAERLGYPVLVRAAFALGGLGSGFADNADMLTSIVKQVWVRISGWIVWSLTISVQALANSPQVIVDKSLRGWKEIEYEIVRDRQDNCIAVCNMENFDPLGIHTGDSIVVAPSQTLSNSEFFKLRDVRIRQLSCKLVYDWGLGFLETRETHEDHRGVQRPVRSGSSFREVLHYRNEPAVESKQCSGVQGNGSAIAVLGCFSCLLVCIGYPLAYVAAHLAMGMTLPQVKNSVTKKTTACFEPRQEALFGMLLAPILNSAMVAVWITLLLRCQGGRFVIATFSKP